MVVNKTSLLGLAGPTHTALNETASVLAEEEKEQQLLQDLHHILFNVHVEEGNLVCPDTGRKFPIKQGIPNMILHEDEI